MSSSDPTRPPTPADMTSLPEVKVGSEGAVDLGDLKPADDAVDLTTLPEPPSGQSLTSWTAVIKRKKLEAEAAEAAAGPIVQVDAPSDRDLLQRLSARSRKPGDTKEIPTAEIPMFTAPTGRSESDIDLGRLGLGGGTGESEVKFDILFPPSDAGGAMPAPEPSLSAVDFRATGAAPATTTSFTDPGSGVNLGAATGPAGEGGRSSILDELLKDAGGASGSIDLLDFGDDVPPAKRTAPAGRRPAVPTPPSVDVGPGSTPEVSGRELVDSDADLASEDAIDLYAESVPAPKITDSGTLEISEKALEESQRRAEAEQSSSVDLSSRPSLHGVEIDAMLEAPSNAGERSDSDVDLNLPAAEAPGESSMVYRQNGLDANSAALAAEFEARRKTKDRPEKPRSRGEIVPGGEKPDRARSGGYLIHGGIIGLLFGAGGVLAAYFAGVLPNKAAAESRPGGTDTQAELVQVRQEAAAAKANADKFEAEVKKNADEISRLTELKATADARVKKLTDSAMKTQGEMAAALQTAATAAAAERTAKADLVTARKEAMEAAAAKKTADDTLTALTKSLQVAGIDPQKPDESAKKLLADKTVAEAKAKDAEARVTAAAKQVDVLAKDAEAARKSLDDARKAAEDAVKARETGDAVVRAIADRLVKAKFVAEKADGQALVKGLDDALKAGSTDATTGLRDEITKLRAETEKAKAELAAARDREAASTRAAAAAKAEGQRQADVARVDAERAAAEVTRLKTESERLTRDLNAVRELAELIQMPATTGPVAKPDPVRLAEQFVGDGLRAFHGGRYAEAESALRKAIQFRAADARYHYLLGLTLWMKKDTAAAEAEFEKGRDLELQVLPSSRVVSASLERIQGPARQAVDAYRP